MEVVLSPRLEDLLCVYLGKITGFVRHNGAICHLMYAQQLNLILEPAGSKAHANNYKQQVLVINYMQE